MNTNPSIAFNFADRHPAAAARVLERLPIEDITHFFNGLSANRTAPILAEMPVAIAAAALSSMTADHAAAIVRGVPFQSAVRLLRLLSTKKRAAIHAELPAIRARQLSHALQLPPSSVGAWTDGSQPAFGRNRRVQECLDILKSSRARAPQAIYVVDDKRKVLGELHLIDLIRAPHDADLTDLPWRDAATIPANMPVASAAMDERWGSRDVLAVTARSGELVGGFSHRDLVRAVASLTGASQTDGAREPVLAGLVGAYFSTMEGLAGTLFAPQVVTQPDTPPSRRASS